MANDSYVVELVVNVQQDVAIQRLMADMKKMNREVARNNKSVGSSGKAFKQMGYQVQNASYQLTDFIVMVQGGISPLRAFSQQAPQLLAGFGAMGASIGVVAALLPSVLLSFGKGAAAAKNYTEELEEATDAWNKYREAVSLAAISQERVDKVISNIARNSALVQQTEAIRKFKEEAEGLTANGLMDRAANSLANFWEYLKNPTEFSNQNPANDPTMARILEQQNAIIDNAKLLKAAEPFGGVKYYEQYQQIVNNINVRNIKESVEALDNLRKRIAGVAHPELVKRLEETINNLYGLLPDRRPEALNALKELLNPPSTFDKQRNVFKEYFDEGLISAYQFADAMAKIGRLEIGSKLETDIKKTSGALKATIADIGVYIEAQKKMGETLRAQADPQYAYEQRLNQLEKLLRQGVIAWDTYAYHVEKAEEAVDMALNGKSFGVQALESFDRSFQSFVSGIASGTANIKDAFSNMAKAIIADLLRIAAYKSVMSAFGGTDIGAAFGQATGATAWAKGGAFNNGVPVQPFATGGIVNQPTVFPMAKGFGLMGEAGAEVIAPLRRNAKGDMGVGAVAPVININNNAPGIDITASQGPDGQINVDVIKKSIAADIARGGNQISDSISRTFGLSRGQGAY